MENSSQPTPKLFSHVYLHEELGGVFNSQSAVAIWYADDKIGVYEYDNSNKRYTAKYFECSVKEIEWVMASMALLTIRLRGRNFAIDFDPAAFQTFIGSGAVGVATDQLLLDIATLRLGLHADRMSDNSGVDEWLSAFKVTGVKVDDMMRKPAMWGIKWGFIIFAGILVFFVLAFLVYLMFQ